MGDPGCRLPALEDVCPECHGEAVRSMGEDEIACPDCEGTGTVATRAGAQVLGFLVRHWIHESAEEALAEALRVAERRAI